MENPKLEELEHLAARNVTLIHLWRRLSDLRKAELHDFEGDSVQIDDMTMADLRMSFICECLYFLCVRKEQGK